MTLPKIDFSQGGYGGDLFEEALKPFTTHYMPFWWHFREVLRANQVANELWQRDDGGTLADAEYRELIGLGMLNYSVFTNLAEALSYLQDAQQNLNQMSLTPHHVFNVRKYWKSLFSSLYGSVSAISNIVFVLYTGNSVFGTNPNEAWNYSIKRTVDLVQGQGIKALADPLKRCKDRLDIRDHLDHFWVIWSTIQPWKFTIDENFSKGYVPIQPSLEVNASIDAIQIASERLVRCAQDFNLIYFEIAKSGGLFDQYLSVKHWTIDYSDYGPPHNGARPKP